MLHVKSFHGFGKRTAAILELYFRFWFLRLCGHRHLFFHLPAKFRSKQTISGGVMTSIESEMYFRVRFTDCICLRRWIYLHAKFRWNISIHGWDKATSSFGKRTAVILEFYIWFLFSPKSRFQHVILHWPAKFRQNGTTLGGVMVELWRQSIFSRWRSAATLDLIWVILDHPRRVIVGLATWSSNLVLIRSIVL